MVVKVNSAIYLQLYIRSGLEVGSTCIHIHVVALYTSLRQPMYTYVKEPILL